MVNITMLIISSIWFTLDLSVSSVPRPYLHMLGSSSLTRVFRVCKTGLHPLYVNVELITPNHHVVSRHDKLSQRCILRKNAYTLKFSERSLRESWIRGCSDSRTIPSAELLDYEDTGLKTPSRVRKGLSLAWKASLAIRMFRSPTIVTDSM